MADQVAGKIRGPSSSTSRAWRKPRRTSIFPESLWRREILVARIHHAQEANQWRNIVTSL